MQPFVPHPSNVTHIAVENSEKLAMVTRDSVYRKLLKLNPEKAHGPDGIPSWLLKETQTF